MEVVKPRWCLQRWDGEGMPAEVRDVLGASTGGDRLEPLIRPPMNAPSSDAVSHKAN